MLTASILLLTSGLAAQTTLTPAQQELLDRARTASPVRTRYALDHGAKILPTGDGRSFYLHWLR